MKVHADYIAVHAGYIAVHAGYIAIHAGYIPVHAGYMEKTEENYHPLITFLLNEGVVIKIGIGQQSG